MVLAIKILAPLVFIAAVAGLVYMLSSGTKKDADRWLVDRRVLQRRKQDDGAPATSDERRRTERRQPDEPATRM